jgi:hypothetical protein
LKPRKAVLRGERESEKAESWESGTPSGTQVPWCTWMSLSSMLGQGRNVSRTVKVRKLQTFAPHTHSSLLYSYDSDCFMCL